MLEGYVTNMNTLRRDGADDTGEQDVRDLRRHLGGVADDTPTLPLGDLGPFVRDKEDVPHEDALPDFYGLDNAFDGSDEVTDELLQLVEDGELCFGWLEDRQEFGFWFPDEESAGRPLVIPDTPLQQPTKVSRRRPKRPLLKRSFLALAATVTAPFAVGMCAYAAEEGEHRAHQEMERPDITSDVSDGTDDLAPSEHEMSAYSPTPAPSSYAGGTVTKAKHAKVTAQPETAVTKAPAGKHRKVTAIPATGPSAVPSKSPAFTVKLPSVSPSPSPTAPRHHHHHSGVVGSVVQDVFSPVVHLLGG
jgi:hypothetical protein